MREKRGSELKNKGNGRKNAIKILVTMQDSPDGQKKKTKKKKQTNITLEKGIARQRGFPSSLDWVKVWKQKRIRRGWGDLGEVYGVQNEIERRGRPTNEKKEGGRPLSSVPLFRPTVFWHESNSRRKESRIVRNQ